MIRFAIAATGVAVPVIAATGVAVSVIAATGVAVSVIGAARAHADSADESYIKVLDNNNIYYGTRSHGLAMGHAVCKALDASEYTAGTVVEALRRDDHLTYDDAAAVAAAAIAIFCPWDKS